MAFELPKFPSRSEVGYLDPEIAGEGASAEVIIQSDGSRISWAPPPANPVTPDWSGIKSIAAYFRPRPFRPWPAWIYHPTEAARLVKTAQHAAEFGVCNREATYEEKGRYGITRAWDYEDGSLWRAQPYDGTLKFDPHHPGNGKTYVATAPNPTIAQHELVKALIPEVAEAVARALRSTGPSAPSSIDPKEWDEFLRFKAWQETVVAVSEAVGSGNGEQQSNAAALVAENSKNALADSKEEEAEWELWKAEADVKGVKVDGRWSLKRLQEEVEKA